MSKKEWKLIRISKELQDNLAEICHKKESYGDLVQGLYDFYIKHKETVHLLGYDNEEKNKTV